MNNTEEEKLNIGKQEIRNITLAKEEQEKMLKNIFSCGGSKEKETVNPFSVFWFSYRPSKKILVYAGVFGCLIIFLGSGMTLASVRSLPGNTLYSLKVDVLEPARGVFAFSSESRASYESSLATERLIEAEKLAENKDLDIPKAKRLSGLLEKHTEALNKALDESREEKDKDEEINNKTITHFQASMNEHAQRLDAFDENKKENSVSRTARESINKVRHTLEKDEGKKK